MKLLFTGRGTSGSWAIRGDQLGHAMGATVKANATDEDCRKADVTVVVKRVTDLSTLKGVRWAYDILDAYPQPGCAAWDRDESIRWVQDRLLTYEPTAVIWPNQRMREDCDTGLPGIVLKHHHWPSIRRNPIRKQIQTVGYEGSSKYIAKWQPKIAAECARRGWQFVNYPTELSELDIVLGLRCGEWSNYATTHWKSNVKLANAHGSGTPFVGQRECGYTETASGAEYWTQDYSGLATCFDWLTPQSTREQVSDRFVLKAYTVEHAAKDLRSFLERL